MTDHPLSRERDCELVFAVVIPHFGEPDKIRYRVARQLARVVKRSFGGGIEVHIGTRAGNRVDWTEEEWPKGGDN